MTVQTIRTQPVIETARLDLRPLRRSDEGLIEFYAGDARVARMTRGIPHPMPPGAVAAFIARARADDREEDVWAMDATRHGGPELMGVVGLDRVGRGQCELGFWVGPAFWNTGIAQEAVGALVAENPMGHTTAFASVFQDNPASARVLTQCGFAYLGDAEGYSVARAAKVPTWTYARKLD